MTTVPHELVHSALGAGELAAGTLGKLLALRYELAGNVLGALKFRQVHYQLSDDDVPPEFKGRVRHYIRV